jgi:alkanesulfonate monooxygenase SsuD/methylene tetrahydromethanopterin reductase-like flavin-dependent oxidoreductase (luciferase family)
MREGGLVRVGIGLPNTVPGARGRLMLEWARRADAGPFASLGVLERIPYGSFDPFASLGAAAASTERIGLVTMVVIGPLRAAGLLAKEALSVDALSGGRLTLGLSIGARAEDYVAAGVPTRGRGRRLLEQLYVLREAWEDGRLGPRSPRGEGRGPPLLVGGLSGEAFGRMARVADGYVHGGGPPRAFASAASQALAAWTDLGRPGRPQLWGQGYFALGSSEDVQAGAAYLRDYYSFTGPFAEKIAAANLTTPQAVVDFVRGYEESGCDQLVLLPTVARVEHMDRLAEVLA